MDFFERQEQAHASSKKLILLFLVALPCAIAAVYVVSVLVYFVGWAFIAFWGSVFAEAQIGGKGGTDFFVSLWQPTLLLWVALITLVVVACGSFSKVKQLIPGGGVVAALLGAKRLDPATKDLNELRLLHVVEEMSVASGTPMPDIYVLRHEFGLNAFVAGHTVSDMVVCVTEGCVKYLSRDELQGIIAHEYSHILHGDMRLNLRLMGWVHGLFSVTLVSCWVMSKTYRERERDLGGMPESRGGSWILVDLFILVVGFLLAFIGWNGAFFGRIIKGAVSRQREFLADAAAVQFTRYPDGLANALKKAKTWPDGTLIHSPHAEEASHIYFCNGLEEERAWLTSTHPPLTERIARVEVMMGRSFVPEPAKVRESEEAIGRYYGAREDSVRKMIEEITEGEIQIEPARTIPLPKIPIEQQEVRRPKPAPANVAVTPQRLIDNVGAPTGDHLVYAAKLVADLPTPMREAAHEALGAMALIYGLLLNADDAVRIEQLRYLREQAGNELVHKLETLLPAVSSLEQKAKIPLVELALPALRRISPTEYQSLSKLVQSLAAADRKLDLFEFALQKMLRRHLDPAFKPMPKPEVRYHALAGLKFACSTILSAVAHTGQENEGEAATAFARGTKCLGVAASEFKLMPLSECTLGSIEASLDNLAQAAPRVKRDLLRACAETVAADGQVHPREGELLRAIADSLDCPIPPFAPVAAEVTRL